MMCVCRRTFFKRLKVSSSSCISVIIITITNSSIKLQSVLNVYLVTFSSVHSTSLSHPCILFILQRCVTVTSVRVLSCPFNCFLSLIIIFSTVVYILSVTMTLSILSPIDHYRNQKIIKYFFLTQRRVVVIGKTANLPKADKSFSNSDIFFPDELILRVTFTASKFNLFIFCISNINVFLLYDTI